MHQDFGAGTSSGGGHVVTVNVGIPREIEWLGKREMTAIWKHPVEGRVQVRGVNVAGDDQADRRVHGGTDKAIYAYASEDTEWWSGELGRALEPGQFGENLTLAGVDVTGAVIGERWEIGTALLEVCQPRIPCWKLGARMNDKRFPPRFGTAGRPGAYLRILREGEIGAGDEVRVVHRPGHGLIVGDVARIYHRDEREAERLLHAPELAEGWREWAERILSRSEAQAK
jgi:MOSC domain-containing protein YiiM